MNPFADEEEKIFEAFDYLDDCDHGKDFLFEMSNLRQNETGLPMIIWADVNRGDRHKSPRIKVSSSHSTNVAAGELVPVSLSESPRVLAKNKEGVISDEDLKEIGRFVSLNKDILMKYWNGEISSKTFTNAVKPLRGYKAIYEMANIPERVHRLGMDIKLNVAQPGDKRFSHEARVKVFRKDIKESFEIAIGKNSSTTKLIGDFNILLNRKQYNRIIEFVRKYRMPLLNLWNHQEMDVDEFEAQMKAIDAGIEVGDFNPATGEFTNG
mgnify:CR=1 FL=1